MRCQGLCTALLAFTLLLVNTPEILLQLGDRLMKTVSQVGSHSTSRRETKGRNEWGGIEAEILVSFTLALSYIVSDGDSAVN